MKILNKHIILFLGAILMLFQACVNDDSFFPDENENSIVSSIAIVTLLQNFGKEENTIREENQCFRFVYPIVLGYNTDATIRVDSYGGLVEILKGQRANFNISGLQFPVQVIFKGSDTPIIIEDEVSLISIVSECQFNSLRQDFDKFNNSCFRLQYPINLLDKEENEVLLNSEEEFKRFLIDQGALYQPKFKFPLVVLKEPNFDTEIELQTYYGFYRILESCRVRCLDIDISDEVLNNLTLDYLFFVSVNDSNSDDFSWLVNGDLITNQVGDQFQYQFPAPGKYEVCAFIETPDCPNGAEECINIEVFTKCPELSFEWERLPESFEHRFTADFDRREDLQFQWFVDGELIEEDGGPNGDNIFTRILQPDSREVCIKATALSCPGETLEYCELIPVEDVCPDLFFISEQRGDTTTYDFFADFTDIETIEYSWFIDDIFIEKDGGPGADNTLVKEFESGTHEICIKAETPECFSALEYCEQITIP